MSERLEIKFYKHEPNPKDRPARVRLLAVWYSIDCDGMTEEQAIDVAKQALQSTSDTAKSWTELADDFTYEVVSK